jgi:outer membrane protein assembly factor BamB
MSKNKSAIAIALFLMATIAVTLVALPIGNAAVNYYPSFMFVSTSLRQVGVGQPVLLVYWTANIPPDIGEQSGTISSPYGRAGWDGVTIIITNPDGINETIEMPRSDPVGGGWVSYTPDQVGEYSFQAFFPETWKNTTTTQSLYSSAVSDQATFTVQEEPVPKWVETPLPNEYWIRPINSANREWYVLAGNWLAGAAQVEGSTMNFAYGTGPEGPHIMWTRQFWAGGIMDVRDGVTSYQTAHYGGLRFAPPIILNGKIFYTEQATGHTRQGYCCVDLYTGETLYRDENTTLAFASIYDYESPNQHGGFPYLWNTQAGTPTRVELFPGFFITRYTTWEMLDGHTGTAITQIANVSTSGTQVYGKDGSILYYNLVNYGNPSSPNYYLTVWNSSAMTSMLLGETGTNAWQWRPDRLAVHDGNTAWSLNVTTSPAVKGSILAVREGEFVIGGTTTGYNDARGVVQNTMWALSLQPGQEGTLLWDYSYTPPQAAATIPEIGSSRGMRYESMSPEDGVFIFREQLTRKYWGFDLETGQQLWETEPETQMNFYGWSSAACTHIYQGKFFSYGYGGELTAYNITTGEILWKYIAENVGFESPYGNYPIGISCIADGRLYLTSSEHSPSQPLWRGSYLRCINASNGDEIWKILFWGGAMSPAESLVYIADVYLVGLNLYDNQLYCLGKGPSATTVTASPKVSMHGSSVLIEGAVIDTAAGTTQHEQAARFPNGVPAMSDEDQQVWMEYVYMHQPKPTDATGVEVIFETLDPNGNFYEIGRTTSDADGFYSYAFTPEVPGLYTIIASFEGSNSYYGSQAKTAINVEEAPQATPTAPPPEPSMADIYFMPMSIGIIIAIVAVGIVLVLMLRKR